MGRGDHKSYEKLKQVIPGEFGHALMKSIYMRKSHSRLDVEILDVPGSREWRERIGKVREFGTYMAVMPTLDLSLERIAATQQLVADVQGARDEVIANNIYNYLISRIKDNNIPQNRALRILVTLGYTHSGVMEKLTSKGVPAIMSPNSAVNESTEYYTDTVMKTFQRGEEPSKELLMQAMVGGLVAEHVSSKDTVGRIRAIRLITSLFSEQELGEICQQVTAVYHDVAAARNIAQEAIYTKTGYRHMQDIEVSQLLAK